MIDEKSEKCVFILDNKFRWWVGDKVTIKEVSEKYQISEATLRYYEKEGILLPVKRKNGIRNYTEENLRNIEFVQCMRNSGMSIERLKKYIMLTTGQNTERERKEILEEQRSEIKEKMKQLEESLERLNYKIDNYEKLLKDKEAY